MLDRDGYRPNVGIIIVNHRNEVFWGKRIKEHSWQFPQGGIKYGETPEQAMFRELYEETGLKEEHVRVIGRTREWLRYDVPREWIKRDIRGHYRGQKQIWFLIRLVGRDCDVRLRASDHPEFDAWRWHDYWVPLDAVIEFKREVYSQALNELSRLLFARKTDNTRYLRQRVRHDRDEAGNLREVVSPPCDPCIEPVEPPCDPCVEVVDVRMDIEVQVEAGNGDVRQVQVHLEAHRVQVQHEDDPEADPEADCRDAEAVLPRRT